MLFQNHWDLTSALRKRFSNNLQTADCESGKGEQVRSCRLPHCYSDHSSKSATCRVTISLWNLHHLRVDDGAYMFLKDNIEGTVGDTTELSTDERSLSTLEHVELELSVEISLTNSSLDMLAKFTLSTPYILFLASLL